MFVRASDRRDEEWTSEAVERREFASKKAKLAAAELAKLSRRMNDNEAGQSFISYISAKILDSIQVSIRNVHILYQANQNNLQSSSAQMIFGLKLSSLKIMKQMSVSTKGQVHKVVEIMGLEVYCNTSNGGSSFRDNVRDSQCLSNASCESNHFHPILAPLNVSVSLSVNRPGKLDIDTPQWSVWAEITSLVICLDDFQLRQILMLLDNLTICQLREQYGRYRPWSSPLQRKLKNWQKLWWHYAQESVLSDVRKKLRKTSWRYFGQRMSNRREYVSLYKKKLVFLRQEQSVDEQILEKLEQMERASDIEDILSYRSVAERELQELLCESTNNHVEPSLEKSRNDERSSGRSRGWLNWLSRGMLGAGGTDDSGQFSGVVSDEVIKDIYEATEFHPPLLSNGDTIASDNVCRCKVKFLIHRISATLQSMKSGKDVAELLVDKASVEFTMWEESALAIAGVNTFRIIYPQNKNVVVQMRQVLLGESLQDADNPSCRIQVDILPRQEVALSIKVAIQPLTVVIDTEFSLDCTEFLDILGSFEFQHERILSSLDGIEDDRARILSKAEYVLSSHRKVSWNVNIIDVILNVPWTGADSELREMSLKVGAFLIKSKCLLDEDHNYAPKGMSSSLPNFLELQSSDLCDYFEVQLDDCEVKLVSSSQSKPVTVLENLSASNFLASCAIMDKLISKRLEVCMRVSRFDAHFSPSLYVAAMELVEYVNSVHHQYELSPVRRLSPYANKSNNMKSLIFGFSIAANLKEFSLHVNLENEGENNSACTLSLIELDIRYDCTENLKCQICANALNIVLYSLRDERKSHTVCSFGGMSATGARQQGFGIGASNMDKIDDSTVTSADFRFSLDYEASRKETTGFHNFFIHLNNGDLHCHPFIFAMMEEFFDRLSGYGMSNNTEILSPLIEDKRVSIAPPGSGSQRFGFSNFIEAGCPDHTSIMLSHFPFVTIHPSGYLGSLENSLLYDVADWRNNFSIRTRKSRNPKSIPRKRSNISLTSSLKSLRGLDARSLLAESSTDQFVLNLNLCGVKVHFHDSSCIVGTVSLSTVNSAIVLSEDSMDILCSAEELVLTSSWWSQRLNEFLWGSSSENHSPVLNVRVKKGNSRLSSQLEVSIGIQHVCCILPPEYLAIIIGYFLLPEWTSYSSKQLNLENSGEQCAESESTLVCKFEILDSTVILIERERGSQSLKFEIPQLYCSFVDGRYLNGLLKDIPSECLIPEHKISKESDCLNMFGRQLSLSVLLCNDDGDCRLSLDEHGRKCTHTLIETLDADVWLRIPQENVSTSDASMCIMGKIYKCELMADDNLLIDGFNVLLSVINQLSSVQDESKLFTSDVLQFLQSRRSINKYNTSLPVVPSTLLAEVVLFIDSLSAKFHHSTKDSILSEPVARAEMQFKCSASLRNETTEFLNFSFSSMVLYSLHSDVILARCTASHSASLVLGITYSRFDQVKDELSIFLPSLDIWLELSKWMKVVDTISSIIGEMTDADHWKASLANADDGPHVVENTVLIVPESPPNLASSDCVVSDNIKQDTFFLIVKLKNIGVAFHFPIDVCNFCCKYGKLECRPAEDHNVSSSMLGKKQCKFAVLTIKSKSTELFISERNSNLRSVVEKISLSVEIMEDGDLHSSPFIQIFKIGLEAEILSGETDNRHVSADVKCDHIDLVLSHQVFYFWHDVALSIPDGGSSQFAIGCFEWKLHVRKVSLLLTDGRWSCSGPLLEILMRNLVFHANVGRTTVECSIVSDLEANYNNIHKVMWEPFIEPWKFQISISRKREISILLNSSIITDIHLDSVAQLNLNFTESFLESVCRALEMIKDAWNEKKPTDLSETRTFLNSPYMEDASIGRYAPYILQNLTSLPLSYCIFQGSGNSVKLDAKEAKGWSLLQSGSSVPIYSNETPEEQLLRFRPTRSSGQLNEKQSSGVAHHFISVKLDGTSVPSVPISMDLVGFSYFEVDFSKASNKLELEKTVDIPRYANLEEDIKTNVGEGFIVPVVFDVSVQRFSKLIRLYSTVILYNETSVPLELRFDIPLGVSPKIMDPIYPGQKFPLPLHLAEAGRIRWRPLGNSYVWSEPHNLPNILSLESKIGSLRSFVCYPSHPSSDPFRCCLSLKKIYLPPSVKPKKVSDLLKDISKEPAGEHDEDLLLGLGKSSKHFIYQLSLSTPLVVHNYLPQVVSLTIESGGVSRTALLSEVQTNFHHVDPSHELGIEFHMEEFKPSVSRFSHAESFTTLAKFSGTKFTASETLTFDPFINNGPIYVTVEKTLDAFSGARELFIFVPYLIYNCVGFPLSISNSADELKESLFTVPSCYELVEQERVHIKKEGLSLLSCNHDHDSESPPSRTDCLWHDSSENSIFPTWNDTVTDGKKMARKPLIKSGHSTGEKDGKENQRRISLFNPNKGTHWSNHSSSSNLNIVDDGHGKAKGYAYSPHPSSSLGSNMVRLCRSLPKHVKEKLSSNLWSNPFPLVPASGFTSVLVPQPLQNAAYVISATSSVLSEPFAGKTRAITFQPRYVISNACSKELYYKQKGTDFIFHLGKGQHSHLHWADTARDLLVCICYDEPGWQWSGSFLPEILGDTQVKMRNDISGAVNMIRVEVQNADISMWDDNVVVSLHKNPGTHLILLSDDDSGYIPYRIENFSKERLRVYQQKCESFETTIPSYHSCPYAWDEPCYPHRLIVEVPGERVLGSYALDDIRESTAVHLPATSEKPERILLICTLAEGATKVLRIIDSSYHVNPSIENQKHEQRQETFSEYQEKVSIDIPYIGISLINSSPQELLFACAKGIRVHLLQSMDQQKVSLKVLSLQIDNQVRAATYPVILSFDRGYRISSSNHDDGAQKSENLQLHSDHPCKSVIHVAVSKWRKKDISLISFEYITLRVAEFHLELEQEVVLGLSEFVKSVYLRFQNGAMPFSDPTLLPLLHDTPLLGNSHSHIPIGSAQNKNQRISVLFPSVIPVGAPWQQIYQLARRQRKIYVEMFNVGAIKFTLSFSSDPWMLRMGIPMSGDSLVHRSLMALADIEGARIYLRELKIVHHMAGWESIQEILLRHYIRQLLHEMYKVLGSAGVIGNPMGFARSLGLGIRDFLSVPARNLNQSPAGLVRGMAQGTTSLLSNTVYALTDAATQFSRAAQKGIVALTFDEQVFSRIEKQQRGAISHSEGVINEVLEGLTGLLQSPIRGAEKHGLPGVLSGAALGLTGLVARPAASILEVTGRTAQSIRNRSKHYQTGTRRRIRLPRPLSKEFPLRPYSWEEAIGTSVLTEAGDGLKFKDEALVMCRALKQAGKFVIVTERLILLVSCPSLGDYANPDFQGIEADSDWDIESEIFLDSVIHVDANDGILHVVGCGSEAFLRQNQHQAKRSGMRVLCGNPTLPLYQTDLELAPGKSAEELLQILQSVIEHGKERRWGGGSVVHRGNIKCKSTGY